MSAGPGSGHAAAGPAPEASRPTPTAQQRAEFRAFVRRHHPDVGGDPETFRRGLARFRALGIVAPAGPGAATDHREWWPADDDPRLDAPITAVSGDPLHRLGRAGLRAWRHNPLRRGSGRVV